jgi:hypothetical protein
MCILFCDALYVVMRCSSSFNQMVAVVRLCVMRNVPTATVIQLCQHFSQWLNQLTHYYSMQCYCCTLLIAIGDCTLVDVEFEDAHWANPELTPVAIIAGQLLAGRLFGKQTDKMDYTKVSCFAHNILLRQQLLHKYTVQSALRLQICLAHVVFQNSDW